MTDSTRRYTIITRNHVNKWDDALQTTLPGWEIKALWLPQQTVLPVFVDDAHYTPENVDAAIRLAGATDDAIHNLGG